MGKLTFGRGEAEVILSDDVERIVRASAERLMPGLLPRMEALGQQIMDNAAREWPRGTDPGVRSADCFEMVTEIHAGKTRNYLVVKVRNTTEYYFYIKEKGSTSLARGHNSFNVHVRKFAFKVIDDNVMDLAAYVAELLVEVH